VLRCRFCVFFKQKQRRKNGTLSVCSKRGRKPNMKVCSKFITDLKCIFCKKFTKCSTTMGSMSTICNNFVQKFNCGDCLLNCKSPKLLICNKFIMLQRELPNSYKTGIVNILSHIYEIENALNSGLINLHHELERTGITVKLNDSKIKQYVDKLLSVSTLTMLVNICGLEQYKEQIISNEITKLWARPIIKGKDEGRRTIPIIKKETINEK